MSKRYAIITYDAANDLVVNVQFVDEGQFNGAQALPLPDKLGPGLKSAMPVVSGCEWKVVAAPRGK